MARRLRGSFPNAGSAGTANRRKKSHFVPFRLKANWGHASVRTKRSKPTSFAGRCHCGNLELAFVSSLPADQLPVRACSCSFCRAHGARTTSDPNGRVEITVHDPNQLSRYRFGLKTADFLVCGRCGIYVAAVLTVGSSSYATVNINTLDSAKSFQQEARSVSYEAESEAERIRRRKENWTPATVVGLT